MDKRKTSHIHHIQSTIQIHFIKLPVSSPVFQAVMLAQDIRDRERGGRAQIVVVEGGDEKSSPELMQAMMTVLGQRNGPLKPPTSDVKHELEQNNSVRLYR